MKGNIRVKRGGVLLLLGVLIALASGIIILKLKAQEQEEVVEPYTPTKEQMELLQGKDVKIPLVQNILIGANQEEAKVCFFNPESNTDTLTYTLYIEDELVYQSEEVEPGYAMLHIKLNQTFVAANYDGMVEIKSYDMETGKMSYGQKQRISIDVLDVEEGTDEND